MDITAFIQARIGEDEAAALAAAADGRFGGRPHWSATGTIITDAEDQDWAVLDISPYTDDPALAAHIARHDPARELRDVEAKRAILDRHHPKWTDYADGDGIERSSHECVECEPPGTPDNWPCATVRTLAAVYSDHPDYDQAWKP